MGQHTRIDPLAIPLPHIDAAIAALVALRLKPRRDGYAYYRMLVTLDKIEGNDGLLEAITNAEHDLGLGDADDPSCLACDQPACSCDARYEDRVSWGLTTSGRSAGKWGVWA